MNYPKSNILFDCIVFYFWLPEAELDSIFIGMHKWWFSHGLAYERCVFYGPGIKRFRSFKNNDREFYAIPSDALAFRDLREFISKQKIAQHPILSIVVEGDRLPDAVEITSASMPIQCFVADTHHMTNSLTSAILFVKKVDASMVFVSHSPHRKIFADCINQNVYPLVYTPNDTFGAVLNKTKKTSFHTCYYGTLVDTFHPERTYYLKKIREIGKASANLELKPRMQPRRWLENLSQDLASFTCSLNGFPSVQSYAPFLGGTCLITDHLSQKSDLGSRLIHEENCLIYHNESEAINLLAWIKSNPDDVQYIANNGQELLHEIAPTIEKSLGFYSDHTNILHGKIAGSIGSRSKIRLDSNALTACYAYEIVQEVHRMCKRLVIVIQGEMEISKFLKEYISILPRVEVSNLIPKELPIITEGECLVWLTNPGSDDANAGLQSKKSFALRIVQPAQDDGLYEMRVGTWINPCSYIDCDFEGNHFRQFMPDNISLLEIGMNESRKKVRSVLKLVQQPREDESQSVGDLLAQCVDYCVNDSEAQEVANACDAAGLLELRKKSLLRAVFLNRECVPALIQLADLSIEAGALVDAALLLSEANRVEPLPEAIGPAYRELMEKVAESPDIIGYKRALAGGDHPLPVKTRRILVVTNLFPPQEMGGYGRKIWEFANGLHERGHQIEVLTSDASYLAKSPDESENALESLVRRNLVLMGEWRDGKTQVIGSPQEQLKIGKKNAMLVLEAVRGFKPEAVLLGNLDFLGIELVHALLNAGIPVVHSLGNQTPWYHPSNSIKSPLYVVAPASDWLGRDFLANGYTAPRLETVYPGARIDRFYRAFLPDIRRLRIAFAGLVMAYKGPQILIDALARLHAAGVDFEAEIAGDSIDQAFVGQLKEFVARHGLADRIRFTGFLSRRELASLFARSNVLVFPTKVPEAFGISQVEAMAGGLIVLTSGTGGTREVVRHEVDGIVFDLDDPVSLAKWLLRLANDADFRLRLQANARERALQFSVTASVVKIEGIIDELLGGKKPSAPSNQEPPKFANATASIEVALSAFHAGRLTEAEDICRELLGADEKCAGAWNLMARMAALNGDLETAGDFGAVACELEPGNSGFVRFFAEVFLRRKEVDQAEQLARRALELEPESVEGLVLLGRVLAEKGEQGNALGAFERALRLRKDDAEAITHYALALQKFGRGKDAISQIRKACALEPGSVEHQTNFAELLEQNKRYVDALAAYGKAARMNPGVGYIWFRQGKLLNGLKRYAEAIPVLEKAVALPGQLGEFYYELGLALHMSKHFPEALAQYEKALEHGFNSAALQCNRGVIFKELRRGGDSIMAFHTAVKMDPSNVSYLNNLGAAALEVGLNTEALGCFEEAARQNPKLPTAQNNIGNLLKDRARGMDALPHYRKAMELDPENHDTQSNYLLCHMYLAEMDPQEVFEEHRKWGLAKAKKTPPVFKFKPRAPGAKLRVGFLSADLCHHPVAHFIEPLFREYDKERFEFVAYGDQRKSDDFSARFATQVDLWRETCSLTDQALAKKIHEDRVDILFELSGHTAYNRLGALALKPAPVQASYLGYPGTTGLPAIDFRITDTLVDPVGMTEKFHTERLIRLDRCAWCYEPDAVAPPVGPLPALRNGYITFGCFNNMAKLNPALFEMWAGILLQVPGSHLRLKARTLTDEGVKNELKEYFTAKGIAAERLDFFGHTRKIHQHLDHYHEVDIALDSYPYHGTTTTCEALWMGCPVVSRAGLSHVSRVGVSLLSAVGLGEFVAETGDAYISKAVDLAGDTARLETLRAGMRDRIQASPLMDQKAFAREFEAGLLEMARLGGLVAK